MDKVKLIKTFQAEQAALRAFRELSTTEVAAYASANPNTLFAENASSPVGLTDKARAVFIAWLRTCLKGSPMSAEKYADTLIAATDWNRLPAPRIVVNGMYTRSRHPEIYTFRPGDLIYADVAAKKFAENASEHSWWNSLNPEQQKEYHELHPNSKLGRSGVALKKDPKEEEEEGEAAAWQKRHNRATKRLIQHAKSFEPHLEHVNWLRKIGSLARKAGNTPLRSAQHKAYFQHVFSDLPVVESRLATNRAASEKHYKMAKAMTGSAQKILKGVSSWPDDPDMISMSANDAADHLMMARHLYEGQDDWARKLANNLDTLPRDRIPSAVWKHLHPGDR